MSTDLKIRYDEATLMNQIIDGFSSLPVPLRQKIGVQMKQKLSAFPSISSEQVDDFLSSASQIKTSPPSKKYFSRIKFNHVLLGLFAVSYLFLCFQKWETAGMASLQAQRVTRQNQGPLLLFTPAVDLQASQKAFSLLQQQLRTLPSTLQFLHENVQSLQEKIEEKKKTLASLEGIIMQVELYKSHATDSLPAEIQRELQSKLLRNILEVPQDTPLLLQAAPKKSSSSLALVMGSQSHALTIRQTKVAEAWMAEWETTGRMVKESMYRSILNGFLDEKMALRNAARDSLQTLEMEWSRFTQQEKQTQQLLEKKMLQRPEKKQQIGMRKTNVEKGLTKFRKQVTAKEEVLLRQRLNDKSFSNLEYTLMSECILLCTMLAATTGPFKVLALFSTGFSEWFISIIGITGLVIRQNYQGNLFTFGNLLTKVFGLSLDYYSGVTVDLQPQNMDQMLFVSLLVLMTVTYFGYYGMLLLQRLWGVNVRKMEREMQSLRKQLEQARKNH